VILAEDHEKSTPVICANEDFFPHVRELENADITRSRAADFGCVHDFHSGFHRIGMPKVLAQMCA
jgi:hypothetical protein